MFWILIKQYEVSAMISVRELFWCLCIPLLAPSSASEDIVPDSSKEQPIGENVTLYAYVFYDSAYLNKTKENIQYTEVVNSQIKEYFEKLFEKVELYFRNHSIMISVKIGSVSEKNDLSSYSGKSLDERATLKNVTAYGNSLGQPSNTIFYLFSWSTFRFASTSVTTGAESQSAVETDGTFCTNNTSGAVILHAHETGTAWSTIKATAFVFGSRHFTKFYEEDRKKMNATFLMCPKHTTIPDVLAC
ncbi:uncharacterized protein LOC142563710 isoform X1 [Dermacentor variabilis]|uniref:uncharacterized protein LOC142563710 isoform X1 n=1 Tax=Dermacentor variabilis TaxID=34621 RepID=UPI003F5B1EBD